jgi:hypothetical protein
MVLFLCRCGVRRLTLAERRTGDGEIDILGEILSDPSPGVGRAGVLNRRIPTLNVGYGDANLVDGVVVSMNSLRTLQKRSGCSQWGKCPLPAKISRRLPGIASWVARPW